MARVLKMTGGKLSLARDIHGCLNICFARPASLNCEKMCVCSLSKWPRGLRRRSAAARLLGFWVRIPPGTWMSVCCECCVLSGRGLCDGLITRPEESYRLWCVVVCNLETSSMRRPWPALGRSATEKKVHTHTHTHTHLHIWLRKTVYELPLLPNNSAVEHIYTNRQQCEMLTGYLSIGRRPGGEWANMWHWTVFFSNRK